MERLELQITNSGGEITHEFQSLQPFDLESQSADDKKAFMDHVLSGLSEIKQSSDGFLTEMINNGN